MEHDLARHEFVGSVTKPCVQCGKLIHRTTEDNIKWLRRAYCNKACQTEGMKRNEWNKRHK